MAEETVKDLNTIPSEEEVREECTLTRKRLNASQESLLAWRGLLLGSHRIYDDEDVIYLVVDTNVLISKGEKLLASITKERRYKIFIMYLGLRILFSFVC